MRTTVEGGTEVAEGLYIQKYWAKFCTKSVLAGKTQEKLSKKIWEIMEYI
jgi:hypothetical protein